MIGIGGFHGCGKEHVAAVFEIEQVKKIPQDFAVYLIAGELGQCEMEFHVTVQSLRQIDFP